MHKYFRMLKVLSFLIIIQSLIVMIAGAYVSATGSGLGCPDWPACHGQIIPSFAEEATLIEFTHRVLAATLGVFVLSLAGLTWFGYYRNRYHVDDVLAYYLKKIGLLLLVALSILSVQVLLGGMTVLTRIPPVLVAIHLGMATVFFGMMIFITREIWHVSDHHVPPPIATHYSDRAAQSDDKTVDKHVPAATTHVP